MTAQLAVRAVAAQLVLVPEQAGEGAEVDHGAKVAPGQAQGVSRNTCSGESGFLTYCGAERSALPSAIT
jgi:hypothetical protein